MNAAPPDLYQESYPVARKHHECGEPFCRRTRNIRPGQVYMRAWGVWGGEAATHKRCERCARLYNRASRLTEDPIEDGPAFGELLEWLQEARRQ